jgi:hypothetical protein
MGYLVKKKDDSNLLKFIYIIRDTPNRVKVILRLSDPEVI